jgi:hypothetical protein
VSSIVILSRVKFHGRPDLAALRKYHEDIGRALTCVQGYGGSQIWTDVYDPTRFLTAHVYQDRRAAEWGLRAIAEEPLVQEYVKLDHDAPNTLRIRTIESEGALINDLVGAKFLSLSIRIAEPGRGVQLQDDLRLVFSECALIPGYTGYLIGVNDALEEETAGIIGWQTKEAFEHSVPDPLVAEVRCFGTAFYW